MNSSFTFMSAPPTKSFSKVKDNSIKKENILIGVLVTLSTIFIILIVGLLIYKSQLPPKTSDNDNPISVPESYPASSPVSYISNIPNYKQQINGLLTNSNLEGTAKWTITDVVNSETYDYKETKCNDGTTFSPKNQYQTLTLTQASNEQLDTEISRIHLGLNISGWKQCSSIAVEHTTTEVWIKNGLLISLKFIRGSADSTNSAGIDGVFEFKE